MTASSAGLSTRAAVTSERLDTSPKSIQSPSLSLTVCYLVIPLAVKSKLNSESDVDVRLFMKTSDSEARLARASVGPPSFLPSWKFQL